MVLPGKIESFAIDHVHDDNIHPLTPVGPGSLVPFPNKSPEPVVSTLHRAKRPPAAHEQISYAPTPLRRRTSVQPLLPGSGDVGGGRGCRVPRVPGRGGAAPQVADAREAAPGGATRRHPGRRGRVVGQHTRRLRGECASLGFHAIFFGRDSSGRGVWNGAILRDRGFLYIF
jgi:hypothetical protein